MIAIEQKRSIYDLDIKSLKEFLHHHELPEATAVALFNTLYKQQKQGIPRFSAEEVEGLLSRKAIEVLEHNFTFHLPQIEFVQKSPDGTVKFLMKLEAGQKVETVLIPFGHRYTVCLSSQVGCAMKCSFCYTGTQGLKRHLSAGEIVGQYLVAWDWLFKNLPDRTTKPKIVFMGQGEPLHNFEAVKEAIQIFLTPEGIYLGPRQITLSTAGYLPGLLRFHELTPINLAVSFHSPFDEIRSELIPLNKVYNIEKLFSVLDQIPLKKRQFINYEYLLIEGLNDREEDALALRHLLQGRRAIVNLIPFNEFPGSEYKRPSLERVERFQAIVAEKGLFVTIRTTKGSDILAACGQLKVG